MAATLSNFFKAIGSQLSANAPAPESFSCSISHQHLLPLAFDVLQQAAELVVNGEAFAGRRQHASQA
jgi:hypothetical protein